MQVVIEESEGEEEEGDTNTAAAGFSVIATQKACYSAYGGDSESTATDEKAE